MRDKKFESLLGGQQPDEKHIEELIRLAGQRDEIDPECTERVREHVYRVWLSKREQAKQEQFRRDQKTFRQPFAILQMARDWRKLPSVAAGLLVAILFFLGFYIFPGQGQDVVIATVDNVRGQITYRGSMLQADTAIFPETDLSTGHSGRLALSLSDGAILKLDRYTHIRFIDHHSVDLISGAVYFDSRQNGNIRIYTKYGVASDIGTQFETRLGQNELIVRVRDGQVKVEHGKNAVLIDSMQALQLTDGTAAISDIQQNDEQWIWADAIDDEFSFDGRSMAEVLFWLARRENWQLQYESDAAKARARDDILRGHLDTEDSQSLLRQLSIISDMRYRLDGDILLVNYP